MKVVEKSVMPDGTKIQIEDWREDCPEFQQTISIAAYPISKHTGKWKWIREGEVFRLSLDRNFVNSAEVKEVFKMLESGEFELEDLAAHFHDGLKAQWYLGIIEKLHPDW